MPVLLFLGLSRNCLTVTPIYRFALTTYCPDNNDESEDQVTNLGLSQLLLLRAIEERSITRTATPRAFLSSFRSYLCGLPESAQVVQRNSMENENTGSHTVFDGVLVRLQPKTNSKRVGFKIIA